MIRFLLRNSGPGRPVGRPSVKSAHANSALFSRRSSSSSSNSNTAAPLTLRGRALSSPWSWGIGLLTAGACAFLYETPSSSPQQNPSPIQPPQPLLSSQSSSASLPVPSTPVFQDSIASSIELNDAPPQHQPFKPLFSSSSSFQSPFSDPLSPQSSSTSSVILYHLRKISRYIKLICNLFPVLLASPFVLMPNFPFLSWTRRKAIFSQILLRAVTASGPCFIKLSQWICSRPDIFPPELIVTLADLQHAAPFHTPKETIQILRDSYGSEEKLNDIFTSIDTQNPVASGAIAQVHKAILKDGRLVALKVRHPNISEIVEFDISFLESIASFLDKHIPATHALGLPAIAAEFGALLRTQIDLRWEEINLLKFRRDFDCNPSSIIGQWGTLSRSMDDWITFPEPVPGLSKPAVLVESFEEGVTLLDFLRKETSTSSSNPGPERAALARLGLELFLRMLLDNNFANADLHAGNVMIRKRETRTNFATSLLPARGGIPKSRTPLSVQLLSFPSILQIVSYVVKSVASFLGSSSSPPPDALSLPSITLPTENNSLPLAHEMVIVDCGAVLELEEERRTVILPLLEAISLSDGPTVAKKVLRHFAGFPYPSAENAKRFEQEVSALLTSQSHTPDNQVIIGDLLRGICSSAWSSGVKLDSGLAYFSLSVAVVEGIGRQLDESLDVAAACRSRLVASRIKREIGKMRTASTAQKVDCIMTELEPCM